jgi:hypothetical protein
MEIFGGGRWTGDREGSIYGIKYENNEHEVWNLSGIEELTVA